MLQKKYKLLKDYFAELGSVAIAFSSGVDSTFLLKTAHDVLQDNVLALTANCHSFAKREHDSAVEFCKSEHIRHILVDIDELSIPEYVQNPPNRCYICKRAIFSKLREIASQNGFLTLCEGSNADDMHDYRPGFKAIRELGVQSPLSILGFTKDEIRQLSKELDLPTWEKPAFACLATRFVYGEPITREKLESVERAEQLLYDMGFRQFRVRIHGSMARIEILPAEFLMLLSMREHIVASFKSFGFTYVTMDLQGYRMGSMNETLKQSSKA